MPTASDDLTPAERRLLEADGRLVDVRAGDPGADDPAHGHDWGDERTVRADFLCDLLLPVPATDSRGGIHALRLRGARITGAVNLEHLDLACPVLLQNCSFDEPVSLIQTRAVELRLPGCHLPSLEARQLEVRGNLILEHGLTATMVDLRAATIGGALSLDGANLNNPDGTTLTANGISVGQGMSCTSGFTSTGLIELIGANISHGLYFTGATLVNATGWALNAQGMNVSYALFLGSSLRYSDGFTAIGGIRLVGARVDGFVSCWDAHITGLKEGGQTGYAIAARGLTVSEDLLLNRGFTAEGEIDLTGARIAEEIDFEGATLTNPQGRALTAERLVTGGPVLCTHGFTARGEVSLVGAKIGGALDFRGADLREPVGNTLSLQEVTASVLEAHWAASPDLVDLRHASVTLLADDPASWPSRLRLRDFSYDTLGHHPQASSRERIAWLQRDIEGYLP